MNRTGPKTPTDIRATLAAMPDADADAFAAATARNGNLTKPPGALGRLETLAIWYASWRGAERPTVSAPQVIVFAGNHGVSARGVSAFPADVTAQMVANFDAGGAAINQLAASAGARLDVVPLALDQPTADFTHTPAMTPAEFSDAFAAGWNAVDPGSDLLVVGEMGIGNTTAAAAVSAALFGGTAASWTGRGTGIDEAGLSRKVAVVEAGLERHRDALGDPLEALRCLGGREMVAMAAAILCARGQRIPVVLDGFICCAAAAVLEKTTAGALDHAVAGHRSVEPGHSRLLEALGKTPLLSFDMRLGEGSGAALAIPIVKGAVACLSGMATFAEAGVTDA